MRGGCGRRLAASAIAAAAAGSWARSPAHLVELTAAQHPLLLLCLQPRGVDSDARALAASQHGGGSPAQLRAFAAEAASQQEPEPALSKEQDEYAALRGAC